MTNRCIEASVLLFFGSFPFVSLLVDTTNKDCKAMQFKALLDENMSDKGLLQPAYGTK